MKNTLKGVISKLSSDIEFLRDCPYEVDTSRFNFLREYTYPMTNLETIYHLREVIKRLEESKGEDINKLIKEINL